MPGCGRALAADRGRPLGHQLLVRAPLLGGQSTAGSHPEVTDLLVEEFGSRPHGTTDVVSGGHATRVRGASDSPGQRGRTERCARVMMLCASAPYTADSSSVCQMRR